MTVMPGLSDEDMLADLHAKYHDQPGNLIYADCGWECDFWEHAKFIALPLLAARAAQMVAEQHGELDHETEEETR